MKYTLIFQNYKTRMRTLKDASIAIRKETGVVSMLDNLYL